MYHQPFPLWFDCCREILKTDRQRPTDRGLTVALPSVDGVAVVTGHAALAVRPGCQVSTVLTHAAVDTPAVTITLARCRHTQHTHTTHSQISTQMTVY